MVFSPALFDKRRPRESAGQHVPVVTRLMRPVWLIEVEAVAAKDSAVVGVRLALQ